MKPQLPLFIVFYGILCFISPLEAQIRIEKNTIPWPYDTVSVFAHDTASPVPDSTLDHVIIYTTNAGGALSMEYVLTDSVGTDTVSKRVLFLDGNDRDTLDLRYEYFNKNPELQWELRKSYQTNGEFDSVSTVRYESTAPYGFFGRSKTYYDSIGRLAESYSYFWEINTFKLTGYSINQYQDSLLISRTFYQDFNVLTTPVIVKREFNFFDSQGLRLYSTVTNRPHPDSSLFVTDSTAYTYDNQARVIRSETYTSDRSIPLQLTSQDTTEYFTGTNDYLSTEFSVTNSQVSPNSRLRYLDNDSLFYFRSDLWGDTCQCWWESFKDSTLTDIFERTEESFTWSILAPNDTSFFHNRRYLYYGNQPIRKYFLDDFNASNFKEKKSYVYSAGDSILSSNLKPLSSTLKLYPNPSSGQVTLEYPSGQVGLLRIYKTDGSLVLQEELLGEGQWTGDMSRFTSGMYFVEIRQGIKRGHTNLLLVR